LFDVANAALKATADPKSKAGLAASIARLSVDTVMGGLKWGTGPVPNVVTTPIIGAQWDKSTSGKYPLDLVVCEHVGDPNVPIASTLKPYTA